MLLLTFVNIFIMLIYKLLTFNFCNISLKVQRILYFCRRIFQIDK